MITLKIFLKKDKVEVHNPWSLKDNESRERGGSQEGSPVMWLVKVELLALLQSWGSLCCSKQRELCELPQAPVLGLDCKMQAAVCIIAEYNVISSDLEEV